MNNENKLPVGWIQRSEKINKPSWSWDDNNCDKYHDKDDDDLVWLSFAISSGAEKWISKVDFFKMRISTASPSIVQRWWSWSCLIEFCNCNWSSSQSALQREVARVTLFRLLFQHLFVFTLLLCLLFDQAISIFLVIDLCAFWSKHPERPWSMAKVRILF